MARMILASLLIVSALVLSGCYNIDSGASQLKIAPVEVSVIKSSEADLVEQVVVSRREYRQVLESLMAHYENAGNSMKLGWTMNELASFDKVIRYNYIIDAIVAGPDLRANESIELATYKYLDIVKIENQAKALLVIYNEDLLRQALAKYNGFIREYPTSDKIDDCAFRAGGICEYFKDYTIAVLYYQRAYQWDPETENPAKFRAAFILDQYLSRRSEALELYQDIVDRGALGQRYVDFAKERISMMTQSHETLE
ncbi:MAG: hypothetical protein FVQ80_07390 [Planctomycetes bacterium]|nr:hypothetical protein [Planctomycetota bacterium]